jgi:digalactosyldiacylglycerol synthase
MSPWRLVHPNEIFETPEQQTEHIRAWLRGRVDFEPTFSIHFYPGRQGLPLVHCST